MGPEFPVLWIGTDAEEWRQCCMCGDKFTHWADDGAKRSYFCDEHWQKMFNGIGAEITWQW